MVSAIILAGGTGQRMGIKGLPKQFLKLYGKPIICYTLEVFQSCPEVDQIIIPCNKDWVGHMEKLVRDFGLTKVTKVIDGGDTRQSSMMNGLAAIENPDEEDLVLIHDGVRPLVKEEILLENIATARSKGNAMTVKPNIETVVVTGSESALDSDFKPREITFTLTAPQTFHTRELIEIYRSVADDPELAALPDASLLYARLGKQVYLVKDPNLNLKITTPEDYYYLKSYIELNESKQILGI